MADMNLPSGYGGLMRFSEEYPSKLMMKPTTVVAFIVAVVVFVAALKIFWPIAI